MFNIQVGGEIALCDSKSVAWQKLCMAMKSIFANWIFIVETLTII